jgi:DNA-binding response OmpR family regulator
MGETDSVRAKVLVAEDDPKQAHLIQVYLEREGHSVLVVGDGRTALEEARLRRPDLLVLDVMMPVMDGLDVCRVLRAESTVPILLVTARNAEDDILLGLDLGADDYVVKPFSPRQLVARVRALLRRSGMGQQSPDVLEVGSLLIDVNRFEVRVAGRSVTLTAREFAVLQTLAAEPSRVFTRAEILERCFGFDHHVGERTVDAHITHLRRKIEPDSAAPRRILTVHGRGYKLAEPA